MTKIASIIDLEQLRNRPLAHWADDLSPLSSGTLLLVGAQPHAPGEALLAARAALRVGCGRVVLAAPARQVVVWAHALPELHLLACPEAEDGWLGSPSHDCIVASAASCRAAAILGSGFWLSALQTDLTLPCVSSVTTPTTSKTAKPSQIRFADAVGLFDPASPQDLTPKGLPDERETALLSSARNWGEVWLVNSPVLVAAPDGTLLRPQDKDYLGLPGAQAVLFGIIGGLLTLGSPALNAAVWGVHFYTLAAEAAAKDRGPDGLLASDVIERLPAVQKYLRRQISTREKSGFGLRGSSPANGGPTAPARRGRRRHCDRTVPDSWPE